MAHSDPAQAHAQEARTPDFDNVSNAPRAGHAPAPPGRFRGDPRVGVGRPVAVHGPRPAIGEETQQNLRGMRLRVANGIESPT